mmetsp:Transcript_53135/g.137263  ORF Transcript_53135/g.137263 Transcript_53135/m.137263 type:complete len:902 (+) Transcript_53135:51-2756(+)
MALVAPTPYVRPAPVVVQRHAAPQVVGQVAPQQALRAEQAILWRPAKRVVGPGGAVVCSPNLFWAPQSRCPVGEGVVAYSTEDKLEFAYDAFNAGRDFGPLDIARTVMYCRWVDALCQAHAGCNALVHITSDTIMQHRTNTVTLCGAYLVLVLGYSPEDAFRPFAAEPVTPFLDCRGESASGGAIGAEDEAEFELSVLDVLRGLAHARNLGWLDYRTFGVEDHASMLRPEHGDMSWLLPGKALALASPWAEPQDQDGLPVCTPALLTPYFQRHGVGMVVQCNAPEREEEGERRRLLCYEPHSFEELGIRHVHMPFEDGGCPSVDIVLNFLELVQTCGCNYAVHCRSGLGRTATLIGAYAMLHFGFTARSFIGWARVMRPGTVHGCQQQYLCNMERYIKPGQHGVAQPGALNQLYALDHRERLQLLPRRELRFWALDVGIPAAQTRHLSSAEVIERILMVQGVHVPLASKPAASPPQAQTYVEQCAQSRPPPSAALRAPDPAPAHRAAVHQAAPVGLVATPQGTVLLPPTVPTTVGMVAPPTTVVVPSTTSAAPAAISRAAVAPTTILTTPSSSIPSAVSSYSYAGTSTATSSTAPSALSGPYPAVRAAAAGPYVAPQTPMQGIPAVAAAATAPASVPVAEGAGLSAAIASLSRGLMSSSPAAEVRGGSRLLAAGTVPESSTGLGLGSDRAAAAGLLAAAKVDEWDEVLRYLRLLMAVQADGAPSWESVRGLVEQLRDVYRTKGDAAGGGSSAASAVADAQAAKALAEARAKREAAAREAELRETELREAQQQAREMQRQCEQLKFQLSLEREARQRVSDQGDPFIRDTLTVGRDDTRKALWGLQAAGPAAGTVEGSELDAKVKSQPAEAEPPWDDARRSIERLRDQFQLAVQQARVTIAAS